MLCCASLSACPAWRLVRSLTTPNFAACARHAHTASSDMRPKPTTITKIFIALYSFSASSCAQKSRLLEHRMLYFMLIHIQAMQQVPPCPSMR